MGNFFSSSSKKNASVSASASVNTKDSISEVELPLHYDKLYNQLVQENIIAAQKGKATVLTSYFQKIISYIMGQNFGVDVPDSLFQEWSMGSLPPSLLVKKITQTQNPLLGSSVQERWVGKEDQLLQYIDQVMKSSQGGKKRKTRRSIQKGRKKTAKNSS